MRTLATILEVILSLLVFGSFVAGIYAWVYPDTAIIGFNKYQITGIFLCLFIIQNTIGYSVIEGLKESKNLDRA